MIMSVDILHLYYGTAVTQLFPGGGGGGVASCLLRCRSGGGFSLACEAFGRMFDHSFPVCTPHLPPPSPPEVEISSYALIPLFMPDSVHSGSVRFQHCAWTAA